MTYSIPHTFTPGTKAKAEEVNDNFNYIIENLSDVNNKTSSIGQETIKKTTLTNCILKAPNNICSYSNNTVSLKEGLTVLIPDGRNEDNSLKCIEYTLGNDVIKTLSTAGTTRTIFVDKNGEYQDAETKYILYGKDEDKPESVSTTDKYLFYAEDSNKWYSTNGSTTTDWVQVFYCPVALIVLDDSGNISALTPHKIARVATDLLIDGRWVSKTILLYQASSIEANSTLTFDLSSYLPNDGYNYDVVFFIVTSCSTGLGLGARTIIGLYSDIYINEVKVSYAIVTNTNMNPGAAGSANIPIGPDRKIHIHQNGAYKGAISEFRAVAYKRIGENY